MVVGAVPGVAPELAVPPEMVSASAATQVVTNVKTVLAPFNATVCWIKFDV